jgi:hypothetical protein
VTLDRWREAAEHRRSQEDAGEHLADHSRLAEAAEQPADGAAGGDDDDQLNQKYLQMLSPRRGHRLHERGDRDEGQ